MSETRITIDATTGTEVNVGDAVEPGQQIGITPDGKPVRCTERGVVKDVTFDSESHRFVIIIKPVGSKTGNEDIRNTKRRAP
jgi:hypothetical protein